MTKNFHWFAGEPTDSVFHTPFNSLTEITLSNEEVPDFFQKIEESGDDRSYVIMSALVAENQLDGFLEILIPGYPKLSEKRDFTFSLKIELLKAQKMIPPLVTRCIDYLRRCRNEFAHNLTIVSIEDMSQKLINVGTNLYDDVYRCYKQTHNEKTMREIFHGILHGTIVGLRVYRPNVKLLRRLLDDKGFMNWMEQINSKEYHQEIGLLRTKP